MDAILTRISEGQGGCVTAQGMGGVFLALCLLFLFIKLLRLGQRSSSRPSNHALAKHSPAPTQVFDSPTTAVSQNNNNQDLAAAIGVALALEEQSRSKAHPLTRPSSLEVNGWRIAGRMALMHPNLSRHRDPFHHN